MLDARRKRRIRAFALAALLGLLGVELAARLFDVARGKPWSVDERRAEIENQCRILSKRAFLPGAEDKDAGEPGRRLLQPYTGWESLHTQSLIAADIQYYRGEESQRVYDICILGGSVAETFGELGAAQLVELLKSDARFSGRELRVHDFAFGAFKQPQPTTLLAYLLALGHKPDAVIEIDGFNEAALGFSNAKKGGHPVYPYLAGWASATKGLRPDWEVGERMHDVREAQERASSFADRLRDSGLWRSSFLGQLGLARVQSLRSDYAAAYKRLEQQLQVGPKDSGYTGPRFDADEKAVIETIVTAWAACSREMHGICSAHGIEFLHVLQPTLHDEGSKPLTDKERAGGGAETDWIAGVHAVYPRLREAGKLLAASGVPFLDGSGAFQGHAEDIYVDVCHFRERGNELLAEAVARGFLERALKK